ncbi:ATP-dependent protease subunit HslV [Latilactobacillus curvatus]|uniref:ATP-dependent protease subunit HslV n=1 Tax=Latilactobacillus curvatus TaxID=28038 RepID=A0AAJ5UQG2_LATCU|nr:ATP-dependent protease subunit HslV [Latilactobacillus curvatus]WDC92184.1 ATP-dependent protease subunit HslV [Latilactobacillus curvatus]
MTTICAVKHNGKTAIAGDGQVTMGEKFVTKDSAKKVRRIYGNQVAIGFAGGVADAFTLQEWFEQKLEKYSGDLQHAAVALAQDWRKDPTLQKLEAMLIAVNATDILLISGNGEVITPDTLLESGDQVIAVGSGGNFAQAAATALLLEGKDDLSVEKIVTTSVDIAGGIDVYTNHNVIVESF